MSVSIPGPQGILRPEEHSGTEQSEVRVRRALEASQVMMREGALDEARNLLHAVVELDASCTEAWLRLAWLARTAQERKAFLRQVLALEPEHAKARSEWDRLATGANPPVRRSEKPRTGARVSRWVWGILALIAVAAFAALFFWSSVGESMAWFWPTPSPTATPRPTDTPAEMAARFVPALDEAQDGEDWERALEIVAIMRGVDASGEDTRLRALAIHMLYGQALVRVGRADEALAQFDEAVALSPDDADGLLWQGATRTYLRGREALEAGEWEAAVQWLNQVSELIPGYGDVFSLLVDAYRHQGQEAIDAEKWTLAIESLTEAGDRVRAAPAIVDLLFQGYSERGILHQERGELQAARGDLEAALALRPDDAQARANLDEVMLQLFPPKRIEIDISKQRLYAWEGDNMIHNFVVSTGLPGRDTATGHFEVLDKIPMAYSSIWRLKMPNWLGIYYVGNIENGIHALPIRPDGSVMWAGLLGQRASYGCIILNNKAARTLYQWAEIGTKVDIHN